jgi:YidC/Oxa1 family membrane protein insertase
VLAILGDASLQGDGVFTLTQPTNGVVRAEKSFTNGLTLIKEFRFDTNYLLAASVRFENHSKEPLTIPATEWVAGTSTPMGPQDSGVIGQSVLWYNGSKMNSVNLGYFNTNTTTVFVFPRTPLTEYRAGANDVTWLSPQNQYFALATMLPTNKPAAAVVVHMINLPPPSQAEIDANPRTVRAPKGLESVLVYPAMTLSPGQSSETALNLFAGPKEYQTLARLSARFNNDIDQIMSFGWFGWISKTLLLVMDWMHGSFALNFGIIIIIITIVIRLIYWPLTQASTRSMKRMQALQPQVKALQEKYKDDPQKFSQKQIELWRKNKVSPLSSCLPMVLQVPVFIAFYGMLRNAIELRGETFLWIQDLSKPDTLFVLPGFNFPVNPMPLIMGVTMLVQSHMVPPSPGMDPGQQKIMRYMPLMMLVFMYNLSSGLALYWTVSNLITILQTRLTRTQTNPAAATPMPVSVAPQKKKK